MNDVYVFGDSHWRVFFPFVNHGAAADNISHEQDGVRTIDTIANELSGATMYGLLNPNSKNGARNRVLSTIDRLGGVDNVGLVFGEVDARFHFGRYFVGDKLSRGRIFELVSRYARFIHEDLQMSGRVRNKVFVYHGFRYPQHDSTLLQPSHPIGEDVWRANAVNSSVGDHLNHALRDPNVHVIRRDPLSEDVSPDGVHLIPERVYPAVLEKMVEAFND
jgi:hypothetical protein